MLTFFRNLSVWEENRGMPCSLLFLHGHCTNKNFFNKQMNADILKSYITELLLICLAMVKAHLLSTL
ncbi:hypothetical protein A6J39_001820 [Legionella anisa]|uniref:Uncharacterized protein n=1 Tax=Legionella anisa TaxID=28082 RepID=A0AAX0WNW0_9GAMM|nr:hypothetical protein A6J39_001820 [Legionella anisa]